MNSSKVNSKTIGSILFLPSILFYSITPSFLAFVVSLPILLIYISRVKLDIVSCLLLLFFLASLPALSQYYSITESIRFLLLSSFFLVFFYVGTQCSSPKKYFFILTVIFYSCTFVVLYYHFSMYVIDGFVMEEGRKGYFAREYLLVGKKYEYTFGVTHLNIYTAYCILYSLIRATINNNKNWFIPLILFSVVALLSESRGPVLFALLSYLTVWMSTHVYKKHSYKYFFVILTLLIILVSIGAPIVWQVLKETGHNGSNRILTAAATDISRLIYFQMGIEHFISKPFGNVLIYTADSVLQNYHNTFLTIANRNGIVAFLAFILAFVITIKRTATLLKANLSKLVSLGPILIYLYCLLFMNIEDVLRFDRFIYFLLAFQIGVSNSLYKKFQRK